MRGPRYERIATYEEGINGSNIYWSYEYQSSETHPVNYAPNIAATVSELSAITPSSISGFRTSTSSLGTSIVFKFGPQNSPPYSNPYSGSVLTASDHITAYGYAFWGKGWSLSNSFFNSVNTTNTWNAIFKLKKLENLEFRLYLNADLFDPGSDLAWYPNYKFTRSVPPKTYPKCSGIASGTIILIIYANSSGIKLQQNNQVNLSTIQPEYSGVDAGTTTMSSYTSEKTFNFKSAFKTMLKTGFFLSIYKSNRVQTYLDGGITNIVYYYDIKFYNATGTAGVSPTTGGPLNTPRISLSLPYKPEQRTIPFAFSEEWNNNVNDYVTMYDGFYWSGEDTPYSTFIRKYPSGTIF